MLFEAVFGKELCKNGPMLRGTKAFFFSLSYPLFSFGFWENFEVHMLILDFERVSFEFHCELETKTVSNFPISFAHQQ